METDRDVANIGADPEPVDSIELAQRPKQPRKRFVGRKAAAEQQAKSATAVEDSGAIQSMYLSVSTCPTG